MAIYEHSATAVYGGFSIFLMILAILSVVGMIFFWPLLKVTICPVIDHVQGRVNSDRGHKEAASQVIFAVIVTALLYGVFILGVVLGANNIVTTCRASHNIAKQYCVSGEIQSLETSVIEYRGEVLGYGVCLTVNDVDYQIELAPGLDLASIELLRNSSEVSIDYQIVDETNLIVRLEILS